MESKWLEDFVALVETRSFSRAAALRHVTQPAFSRRIRSLEAWLGVDLIDRTTYPTRLTAAGEVFHGQALEMLDAIAGSRAQLRGQRAAAAGEIDFAAPHTLSLTFLPRWLTGVQEDFGPVRCRLIAANVHDAVMRLVDGGCDLLLCYHHPRQPVQLDAARYDMLVLGRERLAPYARCDRAGTPRWVLPGTRAAPVPYLAYGHNAYLGRMVELIQADAGNRLCLDRRYETDMAEGLKMMALAGHGVAFLPGSAVAAEVRARKLASAGADFAIDMEIRLYRERPAPGRAGKEAARALWEHLAAATMSKRHDAMTTRHLRGRRGAA
ncbi:MAG: LysR family transcriptional regulator [Burkholderiales bacterium]|nr:LysR family transcriptional regulator [Burkholderiales bacterium]